jgi:hypothetical protein
VPDIIAEVIGPAKYLFGANSGQKKARPAFRGHTIIADQGFTLSVNDKISLYGNSGDEN